MDLAGFVKGRKKQMKKEDLVEITKYKPLPPRPMTIQEFEKYLFDEHGVELVNLDGD